MHRTVILALMVWAAVILVRSDMAAQEAASASVTYTADGALVRPADYREWVYVSTGIGMTYGPAQSAPSPGNFDNVFVNRASYAEFMQTGRWPDKTMFVLEIRSADEQVSINNGGRTQGALRAIEAEVKDRRFPGGWAYFNFGATPNVAASAQPLPATANCYRCHKVNTAVEQTFVQFYPVLMEVARRMGTVRSDYDPSRKP